MMLVLFINMLLLFMLQAMCFQHKAAMIFERVLGVDHPDTVAAYVSVNQTFNFVYVCVMCVVASENQSELSISGRIVTIVKCSSKIITLQNLLYASGISP